jgi:hypothetical protein
MLSVIKTVVKVEHFGKCKLFRLLFCVVLVVNNILKEQSTSMFRDEWSTAGKWNVNIGAGHGSLSFTP